MIYEYANLRRGLVLAWCPSLGPSAALVRDVSGNGYHGTGTGLTVSAVGSGSVVVANGGTTQAINNTIPSRLNGATQATIAAWIWRSATSVTAGGGFSTASGQFYTFQWANDGNLYTNYLTAYQAYPESTSGLHHFAIVFDGSASTNADRLSVWRDGVRLTASLTGTISTALSSSLGSFTIGRDQPSRYNAGSYDDVRVYDRALKPGEISLLASRRGIGLMPRRQRRASAGSAFLVNVSGTWKTATPWVNVGGTWKQATAYTNVGGVWK